LALALYPVLAPGHVSFTVFALFLGASMSVTAFPVLARILSDRKLHKTPLGVVALACTAIDDVTAWCLLAFVVGVAQAHVGSALVVGVLTLLYIAAMFLVVRPLVTRYVPHSEAHLTQGMAVATFLALLASAWLTEAIGIHAIFGAFLIGAVIPHDSVIAREFSHKLGDLVSIVLLPAFFALTGLRTEIGLITGWENWLWCALVVLIATVGKFGGSLAAARLVGQSWRDATALGILMNTRGLMELIVLNIGLDLRLITPRLFAMMVVMALVTTLITTPLLCLLRLDGASRGE
jgi:Kef-type K+ transport system membrane component KefB